MKITHYYIFFFIISIFGSINNSLAFDLVHIPPDNIKLSLLDHAYYYTDKKNKYSDIELFLSSPIDFKLLSEKQVSIGDANHWIKVSLHNIAAEKKTWLLEIGFPSVKILNAFWVKNKTIKSIIHLKQTTPLVERPIKDPLIFLPLEMNANETKTLYIYYKVKSDIPPAMNLYNETGFASFRAKENFINGLFFGIIVSSMLIVFLHWLLNRNLIDLIYSALLCSIGSFIFMLSGYMNWVLPAQMADYNGIIANITLLLTIIFNLLFIVIFLDLPHRNTSVFLLYKYFILLNIILLLLLPFGDTAKFAIIIVSIIAPLKLYTAYWAFRQTEIAFKVFSISLLVQIILINGLTVAISFGTILSLFDGFYTYIKFSFFVQIVTFGFIMALRNQELHQRLVTTIQSRAADKALLKKKDELFTAISHEIKTPLTLIYSPVKHALSQIKEEKLLTGLKIASSNILQLNKLVDQILSLARLNDHHIPAQNPINFSQVIDNTYINIQPLFTKKHITLTTDIPPHVYTLANVNDLERIVVNLLVNSAKYCLEAGTVKIKLSTQSNSCYFEVTNTTEYLNQQDIEKLFVPYYRCKTHQNTVGFGLGLTLVKEITNSLGGDISVSMQHNNQIIFVVQLPLAPTKADAGIADKNDMLCELVENELQINNINLQSHTSLMTEGLVDSKEQILIVEDDDQMRYLLVDILQNTYQCFESNNGVDGYHSASEYIPDLILTDLMMPEKSGIELAQTIRENPLTSHIPIIILTAKGDAQSRLSAWQSEIDAFITKPFEPEELLARIDNLLGIRRLLSNRAQKLLDAEPVQNETETTTSQEIPSISIQDKKFIERLDSILAECYSDQNFNVAALSDKMCLSERQLARKMKAVLQKTASDYIRTFRVKIGAQLLAENHPVTYVAYEVGFSSQNYFSRCFKAQLGVSPSNYTKK